MNEGTTTNSTAVGTGLIGAVDKVPSALEEIDRVLKTIEGRVYDLHERLTPVSMRENMPMPGQTEQAVPSSIHIQSLISRMRLVDEVLIKISNELQI